MDFFRGRVSEGYSDTSALQSRNLSAREQDALYDSRIHVAGQKLRVLKHPHQQGHIGLHTLNVEGKQCHRHPAYGLGTGVALGDHFGKQGVVVGTDFLSLLIAGFNPNAVQAGRLKYSQNASGRHQGLGVLGVYPYLYGVTNHRYRLGQGLSPRQQNLLLD